MNANKNDSHKRIRYDNLPFSNFLTEVKGQNKGHPITSDRNFLVNDVRVDGLYLSTQYERDAWERLKNSMELIREGKNLLESQEVLYQLCENLCQSERGQELLDLLYKMCRLIAKDHFNVLHSYAEVDESAYLQKSNYVWKEYSEQISTICSLFLYLDRSFITSDKGKSIWSIAMELFRQGFLNDSTIRNKTFNSIFKLIESERASALPVNKELQYSIKMLLDLSLYQDFEAGFLEKTKEYYLKEGDRLMSSMSMGEYLNNVSARVHQESIKNIKQYYDKSTKAPLQAIVEEELLAKRVTHILDKGFKHFLDKYLVDELSLLYRLLKRVGKLDICAKYYKQSIKDKGSEILCDTISVQEKMNSMLTFKKKNEYIVNHSFEGDERFASGLKDGLEYIVNLRENNTLKTLAKQVDNMIKLDKIDDKYVELFMFLFRHLQAKDEFEIIYKRDLAKRLLLNNSHRGHEKNLLTKFKKECGLSYTSKLEGMLRDIKQSNELMSEFTDISRGFHANVLTPGFWPTFTPVHVKIPPELENLQDLYTSHYMLKYPRRQLTWQNTLGTCDVTANFLKGTKNITFTLLQTLVLLLFNSNDRLSFMEILTVTQLDKPELVRTLQSLISTRYNLLTKEPSTDFISTTDIFYYHHEFSCEKESFKMTAVTLSEVAEKDSSLSKTLLLSKEQQTDIVLVRVMKQQKKLSHQALLDETIKLLKFTVIIQDIKNRIEALIEKEYIERNADGEYLYLS